MPRSIICWVEHWRVPATILTQPGNFAKPAECSMKSAKSQDRSICRIATTGNQFTRKSRKQLHKTRARNGETQAVSPFVFYDRSVFHDVCRDRELLRAT